MRADQQDNATSAVVRLQRLNAGDAEEIHAENAESVDEISANSAGIYSAWSALIVPASLRENLSVL